VSFPHVIGRIGSGAIMDRQEKAARERRRARRSARFCGPVLIGMGLFMVVGQLAHKGQFPVMNLVGGISLTIFAFALGIWRTWWGWQKDNAQHDSR
jgi:hypothetical protein